MSQPVLLTGIAWDHSRAFPPLVATAQRHEETCPGVSIRWDKRSLDEFGHLPIDQLAREFDLIVIDHPWAGYAFEKDLVIDLTPLLVGSSLSASEGERGPFPRFCWDRKNAPLPSPQTL